MLLFDSDLVTWVELLVVKAQVAAEVVDGDGASGVWGDAVLHGRLPSMQRRTLQETNIINIHATNTVYGVCKRSRDNVFS